MKKLPKLAIVGRPNVGKSALFNRLCAKRISIVDEAEGVTRDRLYATADCFGHPFEVIDTGGIDPFSNLPFQELIRRQAEIAIEEADALILVVDGKIGPTVIDQEVADFLHRKGKPVTLAVNKIDDLSHLPKLHAFHHLGFSHLLPVSALHGFQVADLLEIAWRDHHWDEEPFLEDPALKIAFVGKPNVGKSTLLNTVLGEARCIVSPIAGTTRDSIDVDIQMGNNLYRWIDTAGITRKKSDADVLDKFAAIRTKQAMDRADICILVLDASLGITTQEKKIAQEIESLGKGCVLLFNKWDLVKGFRMEHCLASIKQEVPFLEHCPTLFVSGKTGRNLDKLYPVLDSVSTELNRRISTGELNRFLEKTLQRYHPPMLKGKRLRIYYIAQVDTHPPRFVMFVNKPELMVDSYKKYLINAFRETFGFKGVPLLFSLRGKVDRHAALK